MLKTLMLDELKNNKENIYLKLEEEKRNYVKHKILESAGKKPRIGKAYRRLSMVKDNLEGMIEFIKKLEFKVDNNVEEEYSIVVNKNTKCIRYNEDIMKRSKEEVFVITLAEIYICLGEVHISTSRLGRLPDISTEMLQVNKLFSSLDKQKNIDIINKHIIGLLITLGYVEHPYESSYYWGIPGLEMYNCYYEKNIKLPKFNLERVKKIREEGKWVENSISRLYSGRLQFKEID